MLEGCVSFDFGDLQACCIFSYVTGHLFSVSLTTGFRLGLTFKSILGTLLCHYSLPRYFHWGLWLKILYKYWWPPIPIFSLDFCPTAHTYNCLVDFSPEVCESHLKPAQTWICDYHPPNHSSPRTWNPHSASGSDKKPWDSTLLTSHTELGNKFLFKMHLEPCLTSWSPAIPA